jgi:enoyl-CoA hydratase
LIVKIAAKPYEFIIKDVAGEKKNVGVITLNRPKALNALNKGLMSEVGRALTEFDADKSVGAIVITGSEKAFAAGADIKEMQGNTYADCILNNFLADWTKVASAKKPVIAAVNGSCLI